jgi:hypothetical protein
VIDKLKQLFSNEPLVQGGAATGIGTAASTVEFDFELQNIQNLYVISFIRLSKFGFG